MKNEITILLSKKKKLFIQGCKKDDNYPIPFKLIKVLGDMGYVLSDKLQGMISPQYEEKLLDTLKHNRIDLFGLDRVWETVWQTPWDIPKDKLLQKKIQFGLYSSPEKFEEISRNNIDIPFWNTNNWNIEAVLEPGYDSDLTEIIESFLSSPIMLSSEERLSVIWLFDNRPDLVKIPDNIPLKTNLTLALSRGFGKEHITSVTDILRVAVFFSNDSSNLNDCVYFNMSKRKSRIVLNLLEEYLGIKEIEYCLQDAKKYKEKWKKFSRLSHPHPNRFPRVFYFFGEIQRNSPLMIKGWNSKLQKAYDNKNYREVLRLLSQRPSEFIRKYDSLIRKAWTDGDSKRLDIIQETFLHSKGVSLKVLFDLYNYMGRRNEEIKRSYINSKGIRTFYSPLQKLPEELIDISRINIMMTFKEIWKTKTTFKDKKVYLDIPDDTDFILSFKCGILDKTDFVYPGQTVYFPKEDMIRFFLQWVDPDGNKDLDLHAWSIKDNGDVEEISWRTYFIGDDHIYHSGDVRFKKGDCAEYINVDFSDLEKIKETWILITVQNYEGDKLNDVESWIGISKIKISHERDNSWVPSKSTLFRGKINSEAKNMVAFIINVKEGWIRFILEGISENVIDNKTLVKQYTNNLSNLNLKFLMKTYIESTGGIITEEPDEDSVIITMDDYCSGKLHEYLLG